MFRIAGLIAFTFCALALPGKPARAWGADGHRIVCAVAWDEMTPRARQRVQNVLHIKSRDEFADSCNWADAYSALHPRTSGWHYVDVPVGATAVDIKRDCPAGQSCVAHQIEAQAQALKSGAANVDQADALRFLAHFVGDEHQPLHVTEANGDKGGNDIHGHFMGRDLNMHQVWDSGILAATGRTWHDIADDLHRKITPEARAQWIEGTPVTWANESLAISLNATTRYMNQKNGFDFGEDYEKAELPVVYDRLSRAGVRLAFILNGIFRES